MQMRGYLEACVQMRGYVEAKQVTTRYLCFEDFVLKHGREYTSAPLTSDQRKYVLACAKRYGRPFEVKQCFYNSQLLMLFGGDNDNRLTYCEGFGWRFIPCLHGWLVLDGQHVIDTTWRMDKPMGKGPLANRALGAWNDERAYFGVTFSREYVRRYVLDRKHGGSLIDDFKGNYPLLMGDVEPEKWVA